MSPFDGIRRALRVRRGKQAVDKDVEDELAFHLASRVSALRERGMSGEAARAQAHREFGDVAEARRELTEIDSRIASRAARTEWLDELRRDVMHALRLMRRERGVTVAVLIALALGIGANSAIFTVVRAALLMPLPYDEPDRLVHVWELYQGDVNTRSEASYPDFADWRAESRAFAQLEGYDPTNVTVTGDDQPVMLQGGRVTSGFFTLFGARAAVGRAFLPGEDAAGGTQVVVLSDGFWRRRFGGDRGVIGRSVTIDGRAYTIVGVLGPDFHFAPIGEADLWVPLDWSAEARSARSDRSLNVVARLRDDVTIDAARSDLSSLMDQLAQRYPQTNAGRGIELVRMRDQVVGDVRPLLLVLFGAVALVLAIACANVASLLLARALARGREMAVRTALGASRARLVRQLLTESTLLALVGGALAIWVALVGTRLLVASIPAALRSNMPYLMHARVDAGVLAYTLAVALLTGLAFGLAPALYAARASLAGIMQRGGRTAAGGGRWTARDGVVGAEIALTLVLLIGAGLLVRSLVGLLTTEAGFDARRVMTARVALAGSRYRPDEAQRRFFEELLERVRATPGVRVVGAIDNLPLNGGGTNTFRVEGLPEPSSANRPEAVRRTVAGDYFQALGIDLRSGRSFSPSDDANTTPVIVVNETLARMYVRERDAVGARLRFYAFPDTTWEVIGVVADVKTARLDEPATPTVYMTHLQAAENRMSLAAIVSGDPLALATTIRREVSSIDPALPVYQVATMEQQVADSPAVFTRRYPLLLVGLFAATGLVLAVVGLFGTISFAVARRTREIGIRVALGASPGDVVRNVMMRGATLAGAGIICGLLGAAALTRTMRGMLFGVGHTDPLTYAGAAMLLAFVALLASWVPARRALRIEPTIALRAE
jgi:predicted permease